MAEQWSPGVARTERAIEPNMPPKKKQAIATPQVEAEQQQQAITPKSRSQRRRERQRRRQAQLAPRVLFEKPAPNPKSSPDESSSDEEEIESPRERDVRRRRAAPRRTGHARTLDKFYGHDYDELRNWLYQVEAVADADGWSRRERLQNARVVLSGRARSEVVAFERQLQRRDKRVTWEALTAFLKRKFGPADPQVYYTEKLIECRQGLREDVETFTTRFRNLVFELLEVDPAALSEPMQVQHFVNGLRPEYRDELVRDRPRDLEEAEELARTGERIWRLRSKTNSECLAIETRTSDALRRHESKTSKRDASPRRKSLTDVLSTLAEKQTELIEVIKGQHKEMMDKMEQNTRLLTQVKKSSGPRCDHCKMRGHTKDQCFKLHPPNRDKSTTGRQTEQAKVNAVTAGNRPAKTPTGVTVGGVEPSRILFDSGAEVSTLSSQFVEDIGGVTLNNEFPILTVANGGSMKARGTVILPVEIGDLTFDCRFVVSDELALPVIFGQDFLHDSGASMEFREGTITVRREDDEQRVRLMSLMSEADGVIDMPFDGAHRVCAITTAFVPSEIENLSDVNYEVFHLQTQQVLMTHERRIIYYPPLEKNCFTKKLALTCSAHHAHDDGCILMYPGERRHMTTELEAFPLRRTSSCPKLGMWRPQEDGVQRLTEEEIRPTERESRDGVDPHWPGDIRTDGTEFSATSTYPTGSTGFAGQPAFPSTSGNGAPPSRSRRATAGQPPTRFADQDW